MIALGYYGIRYVFPLTGAICCIGCAVLVVLYWFWKLHLFAISCPQIVDFRSHFSAILTSIMVRKEKRSIENAHTVCHINALKIATKNAFAASSRKT